MKKSLALLLAVSGFFLSAQESIKKTASPNSSQASLPVNPLYSFSTYTAVYQPINGTLLSGGLKWDQPAYYIPLGFNFKLYNAQNDTIIFSNGTSATFDDASAMIVTIASPIGEDLCDRAYHPNTDTLDGPGGISDISYTITGSAGSRIVIIQVSNAGFFGELAAYDTSVSYANFQLWLYETTNDIEFRYGNVNIQNPNDNLLNPAGFLCGLAEQLNIANANNLSSNVLQGPYNNPTMVALTSNLSQVVSGAIQSGRVYKFSRVQSTVGIKDNRLDQEFFLFPNPASKTLFCKGDIEFKSATIQFHSIEGRSIFSGNVTPQMDISFLPKGIYNVRILDAQDVIINTSKIVITE
jgi:hypothetical protein